MSLDMEVGILKGQSEALQREVAEVKAQLDTVEMKLNVILESIAQSKGGWKAILFMSSIAGAIGAGMFKLWHVIMSLPK